MAERPSSMSGVSEPTWCQLNNLACATLGTQIIFATDDWFAEAENLLSSEAAVWREGFTEQGKWMDGWETRRKRIPGHDWCILQLGLPGKVHGVEIDTSFFTGNFAPRASVQAARLQSDLKTLPRTRARGQAARQDQVEDIARLESENWETIVPMSDLGAGFKDTCRSFFPVGSSSGLGPFTHVRLNIFPDGGVARLRVFGVAVPSLERPGSSPVDLVSARLGGICLGFSDAHYGHPRNMIKTEPGVNMGDGWETARRMDRPAVLEADGEGILQVPGHEWAVFRLGLRGTPAEIVLDTNHFKVARTLLSISRNTFLFQGNFPDSALIEFTDIDVEYPEDKSLLVGESQWKLLLPPVKLGPNAKHVIRSEKFLTAERVSHIRVKMFPDGGISRIRVIGSPATSN